MTPAADDGTGDGSDGATVRFSQLGMQLPQALLDAADGVTVRAQLSFVGVNTPTPVSIPYVLEVLRPALEAAAAA